MLRLMRDEAGADRAQQQSCLCSSQGGDRTRTETQHLILPSSSLPSKSRSVLLVTESHFSDVGAEIGRRQIETQSRRLNRGPLGNGKHCATEEPEQWFPHRRNAPWYRSLGLPAIIARWQCGWGIFADQLLSSCSMLHDVCFVCVGAPTTGKQHARVAWPECCFEVMSWQPAGSSCDSQVIHRI